jgi:hypothetical protein
VDGGLTKLAKRNYAVAERNPHGVDRASVYTPLASSIPVLQKKILQKAKTMFPDEEIAVPSVWLIGLQFLPPSVAHDRAEFYTGRFGVKHQVQQRNLRASNADAKYNLREKDNARALVLKPEFKPYAMMAELDDKQGIVHGEPGFPQAVVCHTRNGKGSSIGLPAAPSRAMDHECNARGKSTPSVILFHDPPLCVTDSWYRGQVVL